MFPKKEWWIDSVLSENTQSIWRGSIGGSKLEDHRAKQIRRSLQAADVQIAELIQALAEGKTILAVCEQATIGQIPEKAQGIEWRNNLQIGQPLNSWLARWQLICENSEDIAQALEMGAQTFLINPKQRVVGEGKEGKEGREGREGREGKAEAWEPLFPPQFGAEEKAPYTPEALCGSLHRLLGERMHAKDRARYLCDAIWDIVEDCELLILLHADKHGECLGLYAKEELDLREILLAFALEREIVLVPFSIPIMNGRWNRSVRDFLRRWNSEEGDFPIPVFEYKEELDSEQDDGDSLDESDDDIDDIDDVDDMDDIDDIDDIDNIEDDEDDEDSEK